VTKNDEGRSAIVASKESNTSLLHSAIVGDVNGLIAEEDIVDSRCSPRESAGIFCSSPLGDRFRPRSTPRGARSRACASHPKSSTKSPPTSSRPRYDVDADAQFYATANMARWSSPKP
jgi:hypothetical protein